MTTPIVVTLVAIGLLAVVALVFHFAESLKEKLPYKWYWWIRFFGSVGVIGFGIWTLYKFASGAFLSEDREFIFNMESFGFAIFWALFPPIWFFFEYFLFAIDAINVDEHPVEDKKERLESVREFASFSSRIWAAILALIVFYVTAHPPK